MSSLESPGAMGSGRKGVAAVLALVAGGLAPLAAQGAAAPQGKAGTPLNTDTGIRAQQCYERGADTLGSCRDTNLKYQDGAIGRDTYPFTNQRFDGILGLSFTRVCNNGQNAGDTDCPIDAKLGPDPGDWACVTDNVTGIMWEVKTDTGLRARNLKYTNYSDKYDPVGEYRSATDAQGYVDAVNQAKLCGFKDWNLAHTAKIQTILSYGIDDAGARVDRSYFPNTNADWYWNASPNPSSPTTAFAVDFLEGTVSNAADRSTRRYAQVLRNGKDPGGPDGRYELLEGGTQVHDTTRAGELIWRRCVEGMSWDGTTCTGVPLRFTQEQALRWAVQEGKRDGNRWRVPSVKEQNWLVQRASASPPIEHDTFPNTPPEAHWTSTPEVRNPVFAWAVDFTVGSIEQLKRDELHVLRLARDPDTDNP